METKEGIFKLKGKVQHYAWGGFDYIPALLGIENTEHKPYAEYWMGAHPSASSELMTGDGQCLSLNNLIEQYPAKYIGQEVDNKFHELPYLFKILDVHEMLSIQVHPTKEEAVKGYEREEAEGIPLNATHRNYKDKNHKPEVMVALSEFWLLHGFKNEAELAKVLSSVNEFNFLLPVFESEGYYGLYKEVMEMPQQQVDEVLSPLISRLLSHKSDLDKHEAGYWAAKLYSTGQSLGNIDRGIFSIYFFNIMQVQPGEAVYQAAGIPHAYLEGQNVELMANSDNVLRGGLTPKHIDVAELLKHTKFEAVESVVLKGVERHEGELSYPLSVEDFGISAIQLAAGDTYKSTSSSAEIFIVINGEAIITEPQLHFEKGEAFIVLPRMDYEISTNRSCLIYKAFVP